MRNCWMTEELCGESWLLDVGETEGNEWLEEEEEEEEFEDERGRRRADDN